jgi:anti-sigma factor RsiW
MTCTHAQNLMHAYLDGELDLVRHLEVENHLHDCKSCAEIHESQRLLCDGLRAESLYHRAPVGLRERILQGIEQKNPSSRVRRHMPWRWIGLAAAASILAILSWELGRYSASPSGPASTLTAQDVLAQAVVTSHVRSLMEKHLLDIPSSDRHEVKPWFNGRVDFSPRVPDLTDAAFPLLGGRLDYLDDRPVVALVYQRRKHIINLYLWPSTEKKDPSSVPVQRAGYHVIHWSASGLTFWAISDLNERELSEFVQLVREGGKER